MKQKKLVQNVVKAVFTLCFVCVMAMGYKDVAYAYDPFYWPVPATTNWKTYSGHTGIDIQCGRGTSVYAAKSGTVVKVWNGCTHDSARCSCNDGFGNGIVIRHDDGTWSEYAHLTLNSIVVGTGRIEKGTYIGKSGSSGMSTGPHLHFGVRAGSGSAYGNFWSCTVLNAAPNAGVLTYEYTIGEAPSFAFVNVHSDRVTETTAFIKAEINNAVASNYSYVGALWGTTTDPTNKVEFAVRNILTFVDVTFADGSGEGPALNPGTTYFYKFYVIQKDGTWIFSDLDSFTTLCDHSVMVDGTTVKPTCTADGYVEKICNKCHNFGVHEDIKAQGHFYQSTVIPPTTESDGYTLYKCTNCDDAYQDNIVKKILTGDVVITGNPAFGESIEATLTNTNATGVIRYEWSTINSLGYTMVLENESKIALSKESVGCEVYCTVITDDTSGSLRAKVNVTKAAGPAAPTGLSAKATSVKGALDGKIIGTTDAMEYSTSSTFATKVACTGTSVTKLKAATYYVRYAETDTHFAGAATKVVVKSGANALTGAVNVTGTPNYGKTLKATVVDTNNTGTLNYQWTRDGAAIAGATLATYKVVKEDLGKTIACVVSSTKEVGTFTSTGMKVVLATPVVTVEKFNDSVIVDWNVISLAKGYYVYRKEEGKSYTKIATLIGNAQTGYIDKSVVKGKTYYYTVKAYNGSVVSKIEGVSIKLGLETPTVTLKEITGGVKVCWNQINGAEGYYVYRKGTEGSYVKIATINDPAKLAYNDKSAERGNTYTYTVKAFAGSTVSSIAGVSIKVPLTIPTVTLKEITSGVKVCWTEETAAEGYYVFRKVAGGSYVKIATINDPTKLAYNDKSVVSGTTYYYAVKAFKGSVVSGIKSATYTAK